MKNKVKRVPDFKELERVLQKKTPSRPVLFEFIIGSEKEKMLTGSSYNQQTEFDRVVTTIKAFEAGGYDFAPIIVRGLQFARNEHNNDHVQTKSLNFGTMIHDRESFSAYVWPSVKDCDFSIIDKAAVHMHPHMKLVAFSFDGILENTIGIVGYETLCMMLYDDEPLVASVFEAVGKRIMEYYLTVIEYEAIGAVILNDDWGFNSQTMLSPDSLRKYVFPWYKKIVEAVHAKGKYAILHSCGYYNDIIDDIVHDMKIDAKHSFEDNIVPVETAYETLYPNIAVLGGIDVGFLAQATEKNIYDRCQKMLTLTESTGGYALGSGNSIPDYISNANYMAMLKAAHDFKR